MRYSPRRALALSSPNAAKAMKLIAMRAAVVLMLMLMFSEMGPLKILLSFA